MMKEEADLARMARTRMAAWRLMGDAFEQLLRSGLTDRPERVQALAVAEWLYTNYLTDGQKLQFIVDAGWIMGSELDGAAKTLMEMSQGSTTDSTSGGTGWVWTAT